MDGEVKNGMQCAEFEAVTTDALDGLLSGPALEAFRVHRTACPKCGPMYAAAETGLRWLQALDEAAPSADFTRKVLAATSGVEQAEVPARQPWIARLRDWATPAFATIRQPRFAMTFGMAFFSITMMLNFTGIKVSRLRYADLRPSALVRMYHETEGRVVKYYENIRFVYEVESRVRELKEAATPEQESQPNKGNDKKKQPKDKSSGESDQPRHERYSREESPTVVAMAEVSGSATRRNL